MIFYNNQLMQNEQQLRLYLVSNPKAFKRYEDHEAALQIQIYELIERSIEDNEDPVTLIESYLDVNYNGGSNADDIAAFLINSHQMIHALHQLKDNWDELDDSLPEVSLKHTGTSKQQAVQVYSEITLRSYLEALSTINNN